MVRLGVRIERKASRDGLRDSRSGLECHVSGLEVLT